MKCVNESNIQYFQNFLGSDTFLHFCTFTVLVGIRFIFPYKRWLHVASIHLSVRFCISHFPYLYKHYHNFTPSRFHNNIFKKFIFNYEITISLKYESCRIEGCRPTLDYLQGDCHRWSIIPLKHLPSNKIICLKRSRKIPVKRKNWTFETKTLFA